MNESLEQCSLKKIQDSQRKLLTDLYGDTWKSIPKLIKSLTKNNHDNFNGISKKLQFDDDEKENIRSHIKLNKELYLTSSNVKRNDTKDGDTTKKSRKKLFTEKVLSTPEIPKLKPERKQRNANSTTKKPKINKAMSVTEMVEVMKVNILTEKNENIPSLTRKNEEIPSLTKKNEEIPSLTRKNDNIPSLARKYEKIPSMTKKNEEIPILTKNNGTIENSTARKVPSLTKKHEKAPSLPKNHDNIPSLTKKNDIIENLTKRVEQVAVTPNNVKRLSFMGSLAGMHNIL